ncbi:hypothetical protein [Ancylobacter novellus]|uniref:hypothetical protein n=1 Tax=Ancylobacter novellus TaxID=921 RepID=UPI001651A606|nr:hypothetical protein [Ancylobacter novellus]
MRVMATINPGDRNRADPEAENGNGPALRAEPSWNVRGGLSDHRQAQLPSTGDDLSRLKTAEQIDQGDAGQEGGNSPTRDSPTGALGNRIHGNPRNISLPRRVRR